MRDWGSLSMRKARRHTRRMFLAGAAGAAFALSACTTIRRDRNAEVVYRLLDRATERAFARLVQPDGFWDSAVARINLPVLFGRPGKLVSNVLRSEPFRERLQHRLNNLAEEAARRTAPVVSEAVRDLTIADAAAVLHAGRTGATTYLRQRMGAGLVNALIPAIEDIMRVSKDPILGEALSALMGVNLGDAAKALAIETDNAIWYEIGAAESEIRDDPGMTNDPQLIGALKAP